MWPALVAILGLAARIDRPAPRSGSPPAQPGCPVRQQAVLPTYILHQLVRVAIAFYVVR